MDILSALGVLLAISAVFVGNYLEGGQANALLQSTAFLIVFGGTLGAILVQTPLATFRSAMKMSVWVFFPPRHDLAGTIKKICHWSKIARRDGLLGMQMMILTTIKMEMGILTLMRPLQALIHWILIVCLKHSKTLPLELLLIL